MRVQPRCERTNCLSIAMARNFPAALTCQIHSTRRRRHQAFNSTLGFPGEGPFGEDRDSEPRQESDQQDAADAYMEHAWLGDASDNSDDSEDDAPASPGRGGATMTGPTEGL